MASVFLSYDHDDAGRAAQLAAALETHGHSVWWDRQIHGGAEYNNAIETAVETSDAVIVLWSGNSVRSAWVRDEAGEGRDRGRLVPVLIEAVKPPMGFRQYQTLDLSAWNGGKRIPCLPDLLRAIEKVAGIPPNAPSLAAAPPRERRQATADDSPAVSRRLLLGSAGAAAMVAVGGGGYLLLNRSGGDPRFQALIESAQDSLRKQTYDARTAQALEQAIAMHPRSAKALGLLALVNSLLVQQADPAETAKLVDAAQESARRALAIDSNEPNALLAMFELQGSTLDWITRDRKLREIIAVDPKNLYAISELVLLTQATGMNRESWAWNERALALDPINTDYLCKRALKLWILRRPSDADKVIDQVRALNPTDPWAWWVRFYLYAITSRPRAAEAMFNGNPTLSGRPGLARMWRASLAALEQHSPATVASAREACVEGSRTSLAVASQAVPILSALGELDAAFDVANGLLLSRGSVVAQDQQATSGGASDAFWRISTQWMFTPPVRPMMKDARFLPLCDGIGLTDYWRKRGTKADYLRA